MPSQGSVTYARDQRASQGQSAPAIHASAIAAARPSLGLRWLEIGCGRGDALRLIHSQYSPTELVGVDVIDWLPSDMHGLVNLMVAPAEDAIRMCQPADRVLLIESLDDLNAPWTVLSAAARLVRPGGWLVMSVPNIASLRSRAEFALRGYPTAFRPGNSAQRSPILAHVVERVLRAEGLDPHPATYALPDTIPFSRGRCWPDVLARRFSVLNASMVIAARAAL